MQYFYCQINAFFADFVLQAQYFGNFVFFHLCFFLQAELERRILLLKWFLNERIYGTTKLKPGAYFKIILLCLQVSIRYID